MDGTAHQAPLPRDSQECWSGLPFPPAGITPESLASPALAADSFLTTRALSALGPSAGWAATQQTTEDAVPGPEAPERPAADEETGAGSP